MKLFYAILLSLLTTGCAISQPYSAVAADAATTAVGVSIPGIAEANPIGWATVPLRMVVIDQAKKLPIAEGTPVLHFVSATSWGAAISNLLVIAGAGPFGLAAGVMVGAGIWASGENERMFWRMCEYERQQNKALECVFHRT
jgi:hypothetical protein